jgi:hypothetical protein
MRLVLVLLVACGTSSEPVAPPRDATAPSPPAVGCAGYWSLVELFPQRTSCTGLARNRAEIIVDVVDGAYRARHATGGAFRITHASALGEPCVLALADVGYDAANDTSYEMTWQLGVATHGVYHDREAWGACTHEFRALAARRDVTPEDTVLDVAAVRDAVRAWWPTYASCRRPQEIRRDAGRSTVPAEVLVEPEGRVVGVRARGRTHRVQCSAYSCQCLVVPNATGQTQAVTLPLPVP